MFPGLPAGRQPPLSRSWGERRFSTPRRFLLHLCYFLPATFWRVGGSEVELDYKRSWGSTAAFWRDAYVRAFWPTSSLCRPAASIFLRHVLGEMPANFQNFVPRLLNRGLRLGSGAAPAGTCNPGRF